MHQKDLLFDSLFNLQQAIKGMHQSEFHERFDSFLANLTRQRDHMHQDELDQLHNSLLILLRHLAAANSSPLTNSNMRLVLRAMSMLSTNSEPYRLLLFRSNVISKSMKANFYNIGFENSMELMLIPDDADLSSLSDASI
jgi:hypothetical protein